MTNKAQQVYVQKGKVYEKWVNGQAVVAYKVCPGNPEEYRHINVCGHEILGDFGEKLSIIKHY